MYGRSDLRAYLRAGRVHGGEVAGVPAGLAPHHALHADAEVHRRRRRGQAHGGGAAAAAAAVESEQHGGERSTTNDLTNNSAIAIEFAIN